MVAKRPEGAAAHSTRQQSAGRDGGTLTGEGWQVTYVIVILADNALAAAEPLVLSQASQLSSKPPDCHQQQSLRKPGFSTGDPVCITTASLQCCR